MSNAARLLKDPSIRTVSAKFDGSDTEYTYCTRQTLDVGDRCAVFARARWAVVQITKIHDTPQLDPMAKFDYQFIRSKPIAIIQELEPGVGQ